MNLMLKEFYEMRGLDSNGIPSEQVLLALGLSPLADLLHEKAK